MCQAGVELSPDIVRFEPSVALYSGHDGLTLVKRLVRSARSRLAPGGLFVVEFGLGQDDEVRASALEAGWSDVTLKTRSPGHPSSGGDDELGRAQLSAFSYQLNLQSLSRSAKI